ncbi:DRS1 [Brettanomyces bruxellensis]|uniref:ATP-dependent RNA helicase DRS1 n=1 Tax=Dekkera bruxellensis TaxID=5007 RepID=A0A7D9GXG7_DEKBR|nr:DRS1 [Brettanomyces bruxellensis]
MAKSINNKFKNLDFIPTISDSETEDIPDLDEEDEVSKNTEEKAKVIEAESTSLSVSNSKKSKSNTSTKDDENMMNPDFVFDMGDDLDTEGFQGWNFTAEEKEESFEKRKDVDLDGIIKRKGGLSGKLQISDEPDKESKDANDDNIEKNSSGKDIEENKGATTNSSLSDDDGGNDDNDNDDDDDDDDELALDGFGMGVGEKVSNNDTVDKSGMEDITVKNDFIKEKLDDIDTKIDSKNQSENNDDSESEGVEENEDEDEDEEEKQVDSAEAIERFYDNKVGEEAKKSLFKDFQSLNLSRPVLKGLSTLGYTRPTPVQSAAIPIALMGKDVVAGAQTGSGKTAAYLIPIIERLLYKPAHVASTRVVIMAPTRELAIQVADVARRISQFVSGITIGMAVGGLSLRKQELELKKRPDIVIATPGRFIDHVRNSPSFSVDNVEIMVLDEADRMLEEGFHAEITEILQLLPQKRQTMLFSATMNSNISDLIQLSLQKPARIMIDPPKAAASGLLQEFVRIRKRDGLKPALLYDVLAKLYSNNQSRIIVFVATKTLAHRLRIVMGLLGLKVSELHGALSQEQRLDSITAFKKLTVPILICTDLASRGLDIPKIEVVINYDMPKNHEIYLHRVGRTARAGRDGKSISFVGESKRERHIVKESIKQIESSHTGKAVSRKVDWAEVSKINSIIETKKDDVDDVLSEEKAEKELLQAEMELKKGENMLKYKDEIEARPKRTWFQTEQEKKHDKVVSALGKIKKGPNSRKRKVEETANLGNARSYKKTRKDRMDDQSGRRKRKEITEKKHKKRARMAYKRKQKQAQN